MLGRLACGAATVCAAFVMFTATATAATSGPTAASTPKATRVPQGFVGMNLDGPGFPAAPGVDLDSELAQMKLAGVERIRVIFSWAAAQPYASWSDVPDGEGSAFTDVDGIPTSFTETDALLAAARQGIAVLPIILYAPGWAGTGASASTIAEPAGTANYAAFLTGLVKRYGPHGSFWTGKSKPDPITQWQIWNEPNIPYFWPTQPFAPSYVALLKAAHAAIKQADPSGQVVLAGLTGVSWTFLQEIYAVKGARGAFDVVASHPYTAKPAGVITILRYDRIVMDNNGDAKKPLIADELGWTSSLGHVSSTDFDMGTTEQGQAKLDAEVLPLLAADRAALGLAGFDLYTWASTDSPAATSALGSPGFNYAGLEGYDGTALTPKPADAAFRRAALALER